MVNFSRVPNTTLGTTLLDQENISGSSEKPYEQISTNTNACVI